jgi:hypothetical protein
VCIAPLTHAMIVVRGLIFQPCAFIASTSGLYLASFVCIVGSTNVSCVKVNSIICMVRSGVGIKGSFCSYVAPCMCTMSGRSFARHSYHVLYILEECLLYASNFIKGKPNDHSM